MAKNPPGKETSKRVAKAAGRLMKLAARRGLRCVALYPKVRGTLGRESEDVTVAVKAVGGSAFVQKLPETKGQGRKARRKR